MGTGLMQKRNLILVVLVLVVGTALALTYTFINHASQNELDQSKQQLTLEKQLLAATEERLKVQQDELQSTQKLQRKLPVKPLIDQYLLDIEKAELLSGSQLLNIGIADGDAGPLMQAVSGIPAAASGQAADSGANTTGQAQGQEQPAPAPAATGVKRLTFSLNVNSPQYGDMLEFVRTLEGLERISRIDSLSFSGKADGGEAGNATANQSSNKMDYSVTVSTFYLTGMDGLNAGLPWVEYPKPAGKTNPFSK